MATVEQRDTQPSGLSALSNTLDLFNDFKDDKDSDEESFHLPLLDCDDDLDSTIKPNVSNTTEKENGETEDEILNKFETTVTPDIDPKIEDKLLDEIDEECGKKSEENNVELSEQINKPHETTSQDSQTVEKLSTIETKEKGITETDTTSIISDDMKKESETKNEGLCVKEKEKDNSLITQQDNIKENENTDCETNAKEVENLEIAQNNKIVTEEMNTDSNTDHSILDGGDKIKNNENALSDVVDEEINDEEVESSNVPGKKDKLADDLKTNQQAKDENLVEGVQKLQEDSDKMEVDDVEDSTVETENQETETSLSSTGVETENKKPTEVSKLNTESVCIDVESKIDDKEEICTNKDIEKSNSEKKVDNSEKESPHCIDIEEKKENVINDSCVESSNTSVQDDSRQNEDTVQAVKPNEVVSVSKSTTQETCENSNDFNKNDCDDDLLDISIIRDVDEDNASAIAENANDNHSSEKSDNDDQEEGSEKAENELEESEMEQDESLLTNDKDDRMDFDESNSSNLGYHDNTISGSNSDSEVKDDDIRDSENESNITVLKETTNRTSDILDSDKNVTDGLILSETKDTGSQKPCMDDQDSLKENSIKVGSKRSLNESDLNDVVSKKIKLSDGIASNERKRSKKIKTLVTFEKFMQSKKIENKLTRSDLEQFCLQKICEAIVHKTDVGELHQTIKKQEQIIENLRKDLQQLTKQTRDLDIVNKKLMNELRAQNGIKKPLVPLKITRSVGLQVKLNIATENNVRRKAPIAVNARTPNANNNSPRQTPRPVIPQNANVVRQIATSPRKTPNTTPILSQALQTPRQATPIAPAPKRTPVRTKPAEPQKPAAPGVIDLTDEDDKTSKSTTGTPLKIMNKTVPLTQAKTLNIIQNKTIPTKTLNANQNKTVAIGQVKTAAVGQKVVTPTRTVTTLPQGVRLTPTQVKNGSIAIPASVVTSSAGTTQLMYVVQPTSSLGQVVTSTAGGTQKAVLLNFQSANGVLTSALNGSAVSVIPTKTTNTVQLKTVAATRKHPAPLPLPPPIASNPSLKSLLPKPHLSIRKTETGIILQWRMPYNLDMYEGIASYQLFAYQETNAAPSTDMWRKVGDVKALALPMACTLTQFADKNKYYFAVRSVDVHKRIGAFSDPEEISL